MTDRERTFMSRTEFDARFVAIDNQLQDLKKQAATHAGKSSGLNAGWGYLIGALGIIVLLVELLGHI